MGAWETEQARETGLRLEKVVTGVHRPYNQWENRQSARLSLRWGLLASGTWLDMFRAYFEHLRLL